MGCHGSRGSCLDIGIDLLGCLSLMSCNGTTLLIYVYGAYIVFLELHSSLLLRGKSIECQG